jgi:hypothetical protein
MNARMSAIGLVLAAISCGCTTPGRPGVDSPFDARADRSTVTIDLTVTVRNEHWLPMRVWVQLPGRRYFFGDVSTGSVAGFRIPAPEIRGAPTLRLVADPTCSVDQYPSKPIDVRHAVRIDCKLQKVLANSRITAT